MTAPLTPTRIELLKQHEELVSQALKLDHFGQHKDARRLLDKAEKIKKQLEEREND